MKITVIFLILFLSIVPNTDAQTKVKSKLKITSTKSFFSEFMAKKEYPFKSEFETEIEFQSRLKKKQFDTTKIIYFAIDAFPDTNWYWDYDIEKEKLTIAGGRCDVFTMFDIYQSFVNSLKVCIFEKFEENGSYVAENIFGKKIVITKTKHIKCDINIVNPDVLPDSIFNKEHCYFFMSTSLPAKQAKKIYNDLVLVIGLKCIGYQNSAVNFSSSPEPTINNPKEYENYHYLIDVKFIKLILYNKKTGATLKYFDINQ